MPNRSTKPIQFRVTEGGQIRGATYVVEDGSVQVTFNGRKSTWTQLGGSTPEMMARMLLRELL